MFTERSRSEIRILNMLFRPKRSQPAAGRESQGFSYAEPKGFSTALEMTKKTNTEINSAYNETSHHRLRSRKHQKHPVCL